MVDITCPCPFLCIAGVCTQKWKAVLTLRTQEEMKPSWRQSAHTKGKSKAEIAPALHITCDQAYPVNNTQQLVNIMAYMVYSTLLTSTETSHRDRNAHHVWHQGIYATRSVSEWLTDWGVVEEDGVVKDQRDSLWGSSLVRSSPGHRQVERPTREIRGWQRRMSERAPAAAVAVG